MKRKNIPDFMNGITAASFPFPTELEIPQRNRNDEVIVRIDRVCINDITIQEDFQDIPGSCFAGEIVDADLYSWIRRRVTARIDIPLNPKGMYDWKDAAHSPDRNIIGVQGINGGLAEFIRLPEGALVVLPDSVSNAEGAVAPMLAAVINLLPLLDTQRKEILLADITPISLLAARFLTTEGFLVSGIPTTPSEQELLNASGVLPLGATSKPDTCGQILETTGNQAGFAIALKLGQSECQILRLAPTPSLALSMQATPPTRNNVHHVPWSGDVEMALKQISDGKIQVKDLITATFPLQESQKAFAQMEKQHSTIVQIAPQLPQSTK